MNNQKTQNLILIFNKTIELLASSDSYQWGHMGACNCGHVIQAITGYSKGQIHELGLQKEGDWRDKTKEYCETSGLAVDELITMLIKIGFVLEDIEHLERLSDHKVLKYVPEQKRPLKHNSKEDLIIYLKAWIQKLEDETSNQDLVLNLSFAALKG